MQIRVQSPGKETIESLLQPTMNTIVLLEGISVRSRILLYKLDLLLDQWIIEYSECLTSCQHFMKVSVCFPFYRLYSEPFAISP